MCVCVCVSVCVYNALMIISYMFQKKIIEYVGELRIFYDREKKEGEWNPIGEPRLGPNSSLTSSNVAL